METGQELQTAKSKILSSLHMKRLQILVLTHCHFLMTHTVFEQYSGTKRQRQKLHSYIDTLQLS